MWTTNNWRAAWTVLCGLAVALPVFAAKPVYSCAGDVRAEGAWKTSEVPGLGGRIESPRFPLDAPEGGTTWYALTFEAKCVTNGYWWVDFNNAQGAWIPDVNSQIVPSTDFKRYEVFVPVRFDAAEAILAFVSTGAVEARKIAFCRTTAARAVEYFQALAAKNPPVRDTSNGASWARLPKTRKALCEGRELTIVFLGDSILNDTWCGGVDPLLRETFPKVKFRNIISVCGGGGCWIYHDAAKFEQFVTRFQPDLLVIGGICNKNPSKTGESAEDCMVEVIERAHKIGAEVVVCSPGKSHDPRRASTDPKILLKDYILRAADRTKVQYWDLTDGPVEAARGSDGPMGCFNRDRVHNNDRGKVLNATAMVQQFRAALRAADGKPVEIAVMPGTDALERAQATVRAQRKACPATPITVTLAPGEYRLEKPLVFDAEDSGSPTAPVVWRGEKGTLIRGGIDLGPWTNETDGVVSAPIPNGADGKPLVLDMLFVNGTRAERAVVPKNRKCFKLPGAVTDSWTQVISATTNELMAGAHTYEIIRYAREFTRVNEDAAKILDAVPADELEEVQLQVLLDWSQARRRIVGWDRAKRLIETACFGNPSRHDQYRWCDRSRIRFENLRAGFTDPGDWLYDAKNGKILYRLRPGETAATIRASAPAKRLSKLLCAKNAHDLRFERIAFEFADSPAACGDDPAKHIQMWQGQSAQNSDAAVFLEYCTDVTLTDCRVARSGNYGFRVGTGCRRVTLAHCETWDTGAGAVWMGASEIYPPRSELKRVIIREMYPESCASNVITDCTFRHGGRFNPEGTAIFLTYASDNLITHNRIDDFYYSGITLGYIWGYKGSPTQRNTVSFNHITKIGQAELFDLACIYTLSASYGTVISNNFVSEVGGHGIYMDEGSEGILIENNLCTHLEEAGAFMHFGTGCTFRNNIFAYNKKYGLAWASKRESFDVPSSINFLGNIFLTEDAQLIGPRTRGVDGVRAHNVWWKPDLEMEGEKAFDGLTAAEYLEKGGAWGDVIADPLFVDAKGGDFRLKPESPALKLGFRPWDLSKVGPRTHAK